MIDGAIDAVEAGRRVRTVRAYAGLTRVQLVARVPLTRKQLAELEAGRRRVTTQAELHQIADACEVPREFMDSGFDGIREWVKVMRALFVAVESLDLERLRRQFALQVPEDVLENPGGGHAPMAGAAT